jgi:hypothetical protein
VAKLRRRREPPYVCHAQIQAPKERQQCRHSAATFELSSLDAFAIGDKGVEAADTRLSLQAIISSAFKYKTF